jgi:SNF2 family DNA or RNA helicase
MVLIGNISTAVGYNATVACNVVYVDLPWTPADIIQSSDRSHRIGQTNPVSSYMFFYKDSLEEDIYNLLYEKQKVFSQVVDGTLDTKETLNIQKIIIDKWKKIA